MRNTVLLNLCLMFLSVHSFAADISQDIAGICSFRFPARPDSSETGGMKIYVYTTDSDSYLVQVKAFTKKSVIYDTLTLAAFYDGTVKGILRGANGTLIDEKNIRVNGLIGRQIEYTKSMAGGPAVRVTSRLLFLNDEFIVYSYIVPLVNASDMEKYRAQFFSSFAVNDHVVLFQFHPKTDPNK